MKSLIITIKVDEKGHSSLDVDQKPINFQSVIQILFNQMNYLTVEWAKHVATENTMRRLNEEAQKIKVVGSMPKIKQ
jgi:hypothetical protein